MRVRRGTALIEAMIAGVLLSIVAAAGATLLRAQSRISQNATLRSERNDATRSALLTLQAELSAIAPLTDLRAIARDSIAARIFRGIAIVCGYRSETIFVRYRGLRLPDATKDSALQIGAENVVAIKTVGVSPPTCALARGEQVLALNLGTRPMSQSMWLVFETGAYLLNGHALRYRRGAESRQPITNEVIDARGSSFRLKQDSVTAQIAIELRDRHTDAIARATIKLRNAK
jgi:hypothetical protein